MKLLFISQYFDPETFRGNDIAYYMAKRGVDVTVITGTPNYPRGKFFKGYGWFKRNLEIKNGVKIIRIPIIPRGSNSIMLMLNFFSYAINASIFLLFYLIRYKFDICFVQQLSPVMMSIPGVLFKKITGNPLYTWVLDLWPESLQSAGGINNKFVLKFFGLFAKCEYKNSDLILTSSKRFEESIINQGDFSKKIVFYPQWADITENSVEEIRIPSLPDGFKVMFTGNVGEAQDFDNIIKAVKMIDDSENIKFIIVGDGRKQAWVEKQIKDFNLQNKIYLMGRYPSSYMMTFLLHADALLVSLKDDFLFSLTVPAKIQSYMAVGKPILAMMNGAGYDLINEVGCGFAVPASDPESLVKCIRELNNMSIGKRVQIGKKGKEYYENNFKKENCLARLYNMFVSELKDRNCNLL